MWTSTSWARETRWPFWSSGRRPPLTRGCRSQTRNWRALSSWLVLSGPDSLPPTYLDGNQWEPQRALLCHGIFGKHRCGVRQAWPRHRGQVRRDGDGKVGLVVGAPVDFEVISLPFYLFGADPANTTDDKGRLMTPDFVGKMSEGRVREFQARMPLATFRSTLHPARYFKSDYIVVGPR